MSPETPVRVPAESPSLQARTDQVCDAFVARRAVNNRARGYRSKGWPPMERNGDSNPNLRDDEDGFPNRYLNNLHKGHYPSPNLYHPSPTQRRRNH